MAVVGGIVIGVVVGAAVVAGCVIAGVVVGVVVEYCVGYVVGGPKSDLKEPSNSPKSYGVNDSNSARLIPCAAAAATRAADGVYCNTGAACVVVNGGGFSDGKSHFLSDEYLMRRNSKVSGLAST